MKKIIVPIDFSECSKNALRNAIKIAERMHMELIMYHSVLVPVGFAEGAPVGAVGYDFEELEGDSRKQLYKLAAEFPLLKKIPHRKMIQYGTLHENINELMQTENLALVVMGTHGATGLAKNLIGSNALHVMKHVNLPIIALPEKDDIGSMSHIALAGDYINVPEASTIQLVADLAKAFYAQLHIIHIDKGDVVVKDQIEIARRMDKYLKRINHSFHFRKFDDVEEGLLTFAKELNIELIAMISKQHNFLDRLRHTSHTKKMILDIPMPLMVLHE